MSGPRPAPAWHSAAPQTGALILVVDDDPSIRALVAEVLDLEGYTVRTAANGAEALATLAELQPALVMLDMRMPVMDGWAFAREVRRRGPAPPILVMTAAQNARRWSEEVHAGGYIAKPFDIDDLLRAVQRLLSGTMSDER